MFAALFGGSGLLWQERATAVAKVCTMGGFGIVSGFMWSVMFCGFMVALTMTTVANTLIVRVQAKCQRMRRWSMARLYCLR